MVLSAFRELQPKLIRKVPLKSGVDLTCGRENDFLLGGKNILWILKATFGVLVVSSQATSVT